MPRKAIIFLILLTGISCAGYTYVAGLDEANCSSYIPLSSASPEIQEAFEQTVAAFDLYTRFFSDVDELGMYIVPRHGKTYQEAFTYFQQGFEDELSHDILEAFTRLEPQLDQQVIIPCDGLPVLRPGDAADIECLQPSRDLLVFEIRYRNCYNPGDCYLYQVTCHRLKTVWKIQKLDLTPCQENEI